MSVSAVVSVGVTLPVFVGFFLALINLLATNRIMIMLAGCAKLKKKDIVIGVMITDCDLSAKRTPLEYYC